MKKLFVILVLVLYTASTLGVNVHLHYCMSELVGWSLMHSEDEKCGKCGMTEKKGGCCNDEHKSFQVKTEHQKADAAKFVQFITSPAVVSSIHGYSDNRLYKTFAITYPVSHAPPLSATTPLFIQHCSFLI